MTTAATIEQQIATARETMQQLSPASPLRERQERLINRLKAQAANR
jgi:hypothetical protein